MLWGVFTLNFIIKDVISESTYTHKLKDFVCNTYTTYFNIIFVLFLFQDKMHLHLRNNLWNDQMFYEEFR